MKVGFSPPFAALFDSFCPSQFSGRRNSLLEELHTEPNINLAELFTGPCRFLTSEALCIF